jgi:hypothetical protein
MGLLDDDFQSRLGEYARQRGSWLGLLLPQSAAEMQRAQDEELKRKYLMSQMEAQQAQQQERQRAAQQAAEAAQKQAQLAPKLADMFSPLSAMGQGGPTPQNLTAVQGALKPEGQMKMYMDAARLYAAQGDAKTAKEYMEMAKGIDSTRETFFDAKTGLDPATNQPVMTQFGKFGTVKNAADVAPVPDIQMLNLGDRFLAQDKLRTQPGTAFDINLSKAQVDESKRGWANVGLRKEEVGVKRDEVKAMREIGGGAANRELGNLVAGMRKEYNSLDPVKNYKAAAPVAAAAASAPDTPAGDLDLIYAVGKVLDPNSVVREGELNLVIKSGTPLQRFQGYARMIAQGKGRLPPSQRAQLTAMLQSRMSELKRAHDSAATPFVQQAQRMQLPVNEVFGEDQSSGDLTPAEQAELAELRKKLGRQ